MPIYVNERGYDDDDDDKDDYLDPEEDYIIPDGSAVDVDPRPTLPTTPILGFHNGRSGPVQGNNLPMLPSRDGKKTPTPTRAQKETPKVARKETPTRSPIETPTRSPKETPRVARKASPARSPIETPRETPTVTRKGIPSPKDILKDNKHELDIPEYVNKSQIDPFATIKSTDTIDAEVLYGTEAYLTVLPNSHADEAETAIYDEASMGREDFERSALPSPVLQNHHERGSKELELLELRSIDTKQRDSLDTFLPNVESRGCCCCYNCKLCFIRMTFVLALLAFLAAGTALVFMFAFPEFIATKKDKCACTSEISVLNAKITMLNDSINYLFLHLTKTTDQSVNVTGLPLSRKNNTL